MDKVATVNEQLCASIITKVLKEREQDRTASTRATRNEIYALRQNMFGRNLPQENWDISILISSWVSRI